MQYDDEFLDRVATVIGFQHALNLAVESNTKFLGGVREYAMAVEQAIRMKDAYRDRWKKLLRNTDIPEDQFEKSCLKEIFPQKYGIQDVL